MKKLFCDICEKPVISTTIKHILFSDKELATTPGTFIQMNIDTSFLNHSTDDTVSPDICTKCFIGLVEQSLEALKLPVASKPSSSGIII